MFSRCPSSDSADDSFARLGLTLAPCPRGFLVGRQRCGRAAGVDPHRHARQAAVAWAVPANDPIRRPPRVYGGGAAHFPLACWRRSSSLTLVESATSLVRRSGWTCSSSRCARRLPRRSETRSRCFGSSLRSHGGLAVARGVPNGNWGDEVVEGSAALGTDFACRNRGSGRLSMSPRRRTRPLGRRSARPHSTNPGSGGANQPAKGPQRGWPCAAAPAMPIGPASGAHWPQATSSMALRA